VIVDDGEEHEATLLQIRARLYYLDKASNVWKERGAGNLKINVPIECVDIDETTKAPFPGSFDASALADSKKKNARLVMRQDSTHRVILNTAVIPSLTFKEMSGLKANRIVFTAYEAEGAVSVQIKVCIEGLLGRHRLT
jgi:Ran-binding protein 3